jgi:hypothetical protein
MAGITPLPITSKGVSSQTLWTPAVGHLHAQGCEVSQVLHHLVDALAFFPDIKGVAADQVS